MTPWSQFKVGRPNPGSLGPEITDKRFLVVLLSLNPYNMGVYGLHWTQLGHRYCGNFTVLFSTFWVLFGRLVSHTHTHTIDVIVDVRMTSRDVIVGIRMTSLPVYGHTECDTRLQNTDY